jgi:hypothetical protein
MTPATERLRIKATVRARDGFACTRCCLSEEEHRARFGRRLYVHRVKPGTLYTVEGCVTLCRTCHGSQRRRRPAQKDRAGKYVKVDLAKGLYAQLKELTRAITGNTVTMELSRAVRAHLQEQRRLRREECLRSAIEYAERKDRIRAEVRALVEAREGQPFGYLSPRIRAEAEAEVERRIEAEEAAGNGAGGGPQP